MWTIEITQEDIDRAQVSSARGCAIAVALKDILAYDIAVAGYIVIGKDYFRATAAVLRWIRAFDNGKAVMPITIEIVPYQFPDTQYVVYVSDVEFRKSVGIDPALWRQKHHGKKRHPIDICGEARMAGVDGADDGNNAISHKL